MCLGYDLFYDLAPDSSFSGDIPAPYNPYVYVVWITNGEKVELIESWVSLFLNPTVCGK
jgi:hypothetical protein